MTILLFHFLLTITIHTCAYLDMNIYFLHGMPSSRERFYNIHRNMQKSIIINKLAIFILITYDLCLDIDLILVICIF